MATCAMEAGSTPLFDHRTRLKANYVENKARLAALHGGSAMEKQWKRGGSSPQLVRWENVLPGTK